jgi:hypothetical protein
LVDCNHEGTIIDETASSYGDGLASVGAADHQLHMPCDHLPVFDVVSRWEVQGVLLVDQEHLAEHLVFSVIQLEGSTPEAASSSHAQMTLSAAFRCLIMLK